MIKNLLACAALSCMSLTGLAQTGGGLPAPLQITRAHTWPEPTHAMLLGVTQAGARLVAVGEHGIVLLSDDGGGTWRQAKQVAASSTLSSVYFTDTAHGWAVGQWGVILATNDSGESWTLQRSDTSVDQPLLSVYFKDAQHGWAVGIWSLLLATDDGGRTWKKEALPVPPEGGKADRNLYRIFADRKGTIFIAAEQGFVLRSRDGGATWEYRQTGNKGSLWAGTVTSGGAVFVGGLLGHLYRSGDGGDTWSSVASAASSSITDLVASGTRVVGVGLDGYIIDCAGDGGPCTSKQRGDRAALTALLVPHSNAQILLSKEGIVAAH